MIIIDASGATSGIDFEAFIRGGFVADQNGGGAPSWGTKPFPQAERSGRLVALASGDPADSDALPIRADARVLGARLKRGETVEFRLGPGRHAYLVPASGTLQVNDVRVGARDGAAIRDESALTITALEDSELVLVDAAA